MTARLSIRARVTALAALAVLVVLAVAGVGLVLAQRAALTEALDETVEATADALADRVREGAPLASWVPAADDVGVRVVDPDASVLLAEPELPAGPGRTATRDVDGTVVTVGASTEDVAESTAALGWSLLVAVPVAAAVLALVVWWSVGRALRPVEAIRAEVEAITADRLHRRVSEPSSADEVARLARTMNRMLTRLDAAAEQQRRFVADASHELRSPLARVRTELEVDAAHPATADLAATARSVHTEVVGLQRLVDDLLLLARSDAAAADGVARGSLVDLDEVVTAAVRGARLPVGGRAVAVDVPALAPLQVRGDAGQLRRAVGNLVDNAVRHAERAVTVTLTAAHDGAGTLAEVVVADDGPGVPADRAAEVFHRFTRLDDARRAGDGGVGLGLAISRDVAERHGGTLVLDPCGPGARFVLRLPAAT